MFRSINTVFGLIVFLFGLGSIRSSPAINFYQSIKLRQYKALEILQYMNTSVEACENFYEFSCGNYRKYFDQQVHANDKYSPVFYAMQSAEYKVEKELNTTYADDTEMDRKVKGFYKSCLNRSKDLGFYRRKMRQLVQEFGQMPAMEGENWLEENFKWSEVVANINAKMGLGIIINAKMTPDSWNNTINRVTLQQPQFTFPKPIYYEDPQFESYRLSVKSQIYENLQIFLNMDPKLAIQVTEEIFDFEIALAHGMQDLESEKPDLVFNVSKISDVQSHFIRSWDTIKHLESALKVNPTYIQVQYIYLQNLAEIIQRFPKRQVANYIFYTYLKEYMDLLSYSSTCRELMVKHFNAYLENMMYRKYTSTEARSYILFMWQQIKSAFEDTLNSNSLYWISRTTLRRAIEKLKAMQIEFVSYDHINFPTKYENLKFPHPTDIVENIHSILLLHGREGRANVNQPPIYPEPPTGMPAYSPELNVFYFPVSVLMENTIWSPSYPLAINFGSIGTLMGHEMIHGFDDLGRHFDMKGNYNNWWDTISSQHFEDRRRCFIDQYHNYKFRGIHLPALENQSENIADNVGIQHAYKAYMKWYTTASVLNQQNEFLPGVTFTPDQLFFISFAQMTGGAVSENFLYDNDDHVPMELRLKGSLDNMLEFSKAFNCSRRSSMNPQLKCKLY